MGGGVAGALASVLSPFMSASSLPALLAGAAVADLTPSGSVFLYGYPHVPRNSTGVHDPLECAALYLRRGAEHALFLANDVICVPRAIAAEVRRRVQAETGVPEGAILISATHTHSGPVITNYVSNSADPILPKADPKYLQHIIGQMVKAACAAIQGAEPAEVGLAVARAEGVGTNRHDPAGPADPEVPVLVARSLASKRPLGCMVVYGMHPTVLHEDSKLISADFPGFTRRHLRQAALPPGCPVIYHNGASGNQSPRHVTKANTFAEAERLGVKLAEAIAAALPRAQFLPAPAIRHRQRALPLIPRTFPSVAEASEGLTSTRARFDRLKAEGAPRTAVRTAECDVFGAEETLVLARAAADGRLAAAIGSSSPAEIQLIEIGPWRFVGWPGEFFVEYALELKARLPGTFVITLANGELQGYVVTADADARRAYEASNAIFSHENGPRMVAATVELARELA